MDTPDVQPHEPAARYTDTLGKYIAIYVCILILAGLQFGIAYSHVDTTAKFARMLLIALAEAGGADRCARVDTGGPGSVHAMGAFSLLRESLREFSSSR